MWEGESVPITERSGAMIIQRPQYILDLRAYCFEQLAKECDRMCTSETDGPGTFERLRVVLG